MVLVDQRLKMSDIVEAHTTSKEFLAWVPLCKEHQGDSVSQQSQGTRFKSTSITFRRAEQSMTKIMPTHYTSPMTICKKTTAFGPETILSHQENASVLTCVVAKYKLNELENTLLPRTPYSADLAPRDYFMLSYLKKYPGGKKFGFK